MKKHIEGLYNEIDITIFVDVFPLQVFFQKMISTTFSKMYAHDHKKRALKFARETKNS